MQHDAAVELLARTPMFRGLGGELLTAILQGGSTRGFSAGQQLAVAGARADAGLFILSGNVTLVDSSGCSLEVQIVPGMFINEIAMFVETTHFYGAVAVDEVVAFSLPRAAMRLLMRQQPYLAVHFVRMISQNLEMTKATLRELDETLTLSTPKIPLFDEAPMANGAANGVSHGLGGGASNGASNGAPDDLASALPVQDLLAGLNKANGHSDQIPPVQEHDQKAFPNRAPHRSPLVKRRTTLEPASPRYGQAAGPGSNPASSVLGNSTR